MIKRTLITLFSVVVMISYIFRNITVTSFSQENILFFLTFIFPYILMNGIACFFLVISMFKKPKDMNENFWVVLSSFLGTNLSVIAGHFVQLRAGTLNSGISVLGSVLSIIIIPFYIAAVINLGRNLTVLPEANGLNTKGIYSISRHPLYTCYIYWYFTQILIYQSAAILIVSIVQAGFQIIRANYEEKILEKNFPEYKEYKRRVWWIGRIKKEAV